MTDQSFTLVPTDWLHRMEHELRGMRRQLEGATVVPAPQWLTVTDAAKALGVINSVIDVETVNVARNTGQKSNP